MLRSARGFTLDACPLEHLLFAPRPWRPAAAATLDAEWTAFLHSLRGSRVLPPRLLVAPVRAWRAPLGREDAALWPRQLPTVLTLRPACWDILARACGDALAGSRLGPAPGDTHGNNGKAAQDRRPELVGFFLVEAAPPHGLCAQAAWLFPVHPDIWLPAADEGAVRRIDALLAHGRPFRCGFDAPAPTRGPAHTQA